MKYLDLSVATEVREGNFRRIPHAVSLEQV
jgi:hypothetical protein